jgi:hypothetical protein
VPARRFAGGAKPVCARGADPALSRGLSTLSLGSRVERVVHVTFGVHVPEDSVGSMLTGLGGSGSVRAIDETRRRYEVRVRRARQLRHLEEQLTRWEQFGFLTYKWAAT